MEERKGFSLKAEFWYQRAWRPSMAFVYMILCILDYGVRPIINYINYKKQDISEVVMIIKDLRPAVQIKVIELEKQEFIKPILTEFVHLSFGAILGVSAFTRGLEKKNNRENNN